MKYNPKNVRISPKNFFVGWQLCGCKQGKSCFNNKQKRNLFSRDQTSRDGAYEEELWLNLFFLVLFTTDKI